MTGGTGQNTLRKIPGITNQKMELHNTGLNTYISFPRSGWAECLARWVSALISPPLVAVAGIIMATHTIAKSSAWFWAAFILQLSVILPVIYVLWLLRVGKVTSFHLDIREELKRPLLLVLLNIILVCTVLVIAGAPDVLLMIATAGLILGALIFFAMLHWKISGHCAAAGGLAALTCVLFGQEAVLMSVIIPIVAWSVYNFVHITYLRLWLVLYWVGPYSP